MSSFRLISHSFSFLKDEVGLRKSGAEGGKEGKREEGREDKLTEQEKPQRNSPVPPAHPTNHPGSPPARSKALQKGSEKASESHFLLPILPSFLSPSPQSFETPFSGKEPFEWME